MPSATPAAVRKQVAQGKPDPLYLIVGDDDAEMLTLAGDFASLVEDELRAFNMERVYATDKGVTPASIVESAQLLPMMADRRVVVVLRAEKLLKPKRRGKLDEDVDPDDDSAPVESDALEAYVKNPEPRSVLVLVASDVDRTRRLYKALQKTATIGKPNRSSVRPSPTPGSKSIRRLRGSSRSVPARISRGCAATSVDCCCTPRADRR